MGRTDRPDHSGVLKRPIVYAITGPTAVGKTALSLEIAEHLGAEIVSCDSRQVYRELTIGTAKPTEAELGRVRHHFIDERSLSEPWSAGTFADAAESRIAGLHASGKEALVVGGSTLYLHALAHGLSPLPAADPATREELNQVALTDAGRQALYDELREVDPEAAATLDPTKSQRLVRFVEVYRSTGRPASSYWREASPPRFNVRVVVLDRPREELYARIHSRVDAMLEEGLLDEVRALRERGWVRETAPVMRTIGYQEPLRFLDGDLAYDEMVEVLKQNTRRYAKRQLTWFRRDVSYVWRRADSSLGDVLAAFENP